jgi:hypothetical protein
LFLDSGLSYICHDTMIFPCTAWWSKQGTDAQCQWTEHLQLIAVPRAQPRTFPFGMFPDQKSRTQFKGRVLLFIIGTLAPESWDIHKSTDDKWTGSLIWLHDRWHWNFFSIPGMYIFVINLCIGLRNSAPHWCGTRLFSRWTRSDKNVTFSVWWTNPHCNHHSESIDWHLHRGIIYLQQYL